MTAEARHESLHVQRIATWVPMTDDDLAWGAHVRETIEWMLAHPKEAQQAAEARMASPDYCNCGQLRPGPCQRHADLTDIERDAAAALYADPDIEVGSEGIGGFYAGQAEETIAVLRRAGFRLVRADPPTILETPDDPSEDDPLDVPTDTVASEEPE